MQANTPGNKAGAPLVEPVRQRSPIKRAMDRMFGRSPPKKKVGTSVSKVVEGIPPLNQIQPPNVNIGNYKVKDDYIKEE